MDKKNILVIFGGVSPEHEISKISADTVIKHLSEEKYHVIPVYITKEGKWLLYDGTIDHIKNIAWEKFGTPAILSPDRVNCGLLRIVGDKVRTIPVDVVLPVLHGENGEDGTIQGLCALAGIPCTGCGVLASAITMDKTFMRVIANSAGIPQTKYMVFREHELKDAPKTIRYQLGYPCFIKPANAGSSVGITKAANKKEVVEALKIAASVDKKIIAERAVTGREIECGVLGAAGWSGGPGDTDIIVSVPGEIVSGSQFYDYDAKYNSPESQTIVPAPIPPEVAEQIQQMAANIFRAMDASGLARVDFFLTDDNQVIFNEINSIPGFTSISLFPMVWEASGVPFADWLDILIDIALFSQAKRGKV